MKLSGPVSWLPKVAKIGPLGRKYSPLPPPPPPPPSQTTKKRREGSQREDFAFVADLFCNLGNHDTGPDGFHHKRLPGYYGPTAQRNYVNIAGLWQKNVGITSESYDPRPNSYAAYSIITQNTQTPNL